MATYIIINIIFLCLIAVFIWRLKTSRLAASLIIMISILLILTAIFDSLIIYFGIVGYDHTKISGLFIGLAPVEDFAYALAAGLLIPTLWRRLNKKGEL